MAKRPYFKLGIDALEARFVSSTQSDTADQPGQLLGFVLQGKAVSQRQAWVAAIVV